MAAVAEKGKIGAAGKKAEGMAAQVADKYSKPAAAPGKDPHDHGATLRDELVKAEGKGDAPDSNLRDKIAGPIGGDPKDARLHTGPASAAAAQALRANAFTIGTDVFFGAGKFDPHTPKGVGLVAHEATHVLQQKGAKGDKARFDSQRGGDEMEQEAQEAAQLVLRDVGRGEYLVVGEFVRNYTSEEGGAVASANRTRLDAISLLALKQAKSELRRRGIGDVPPQRELSVDLELDLAEMDDEEATRVWSEAIIAAISPLRVPNSLHKRAIQRDPTPAPVAPPPGASPTGPDDPETLSVKLIDPKLGLNAAFTLRHFSGVMESDLRAIGVSQVRLLVAATEGAAGIPADGPDSNHYGSNLIWLEASPYEDSAKKFYRKMPQFKAVAAKLAEERKAFLKEFVDKGAKVMLALITESRARVNETMKKYGIVKTINTQSSNQTASFSSTSNSLDKLKTIAAGLLPKRQRLERMLESQENLKSKWHIAFTSASKLSREEEDVKNLPETAAAWNKDFAAAKEEYPIISHYETASGLEGLATGPSIVTNIGTTLDRMLTNLNDLENRLKDPTTIYKLGAGFEAVKKAYKPELNELQLAYVGMDAADRQKAEEDLKLYLTLFTVVLGAMTGGLGGFALLAAEAVVAGISTYQLLQQISDYQLQSAASMSDPELARCLSATEPSLGWLVFDIITTVVGLKGNVGRMRQAVDEIRNSFKLAQAYGDVAKLEKALTAWDVPGATKTKILNQVYHATTTIAGFIRNPDPITAFGVINLFGSFYNLRTSLYKEKSEPAQLTKAKETLQAARVKAVQAALDQTKAKYPLITVRLIDSGFDHPLNIAVGSAEVPIAKVLPVPTDAPAQKTLAGSPAPDPNPQAKSGGTLKGVHPPGPTPPGGTQKGVGKPPPIPDGVYAATVKGPSAKDGDTKQSPASLQGQPAPPDPALAGTQAPSKPAAPAPAGGGDTKPSGDPALAKTGAAPAPTPAQAQMKAAIEDITNLGGQQPLKAATDINILDPQQPTHGGMVWDPAKKEFVEDKSKAPLGAPPPMRPAKMSDADYQKMLEAQGWHKPAGMSVKDFEQSLKGPGWSIADAKRLGIEYQGQYVRLPEGRFKVVPSNLGGTSVKFLLQDTVTGHKYLFKPGAGEAYLHPDYKVQGTTLFVRGAFAARLAQEMGAVEGVPMMAVVVHEGRVGSLQPFLEGTVSLADLQAGKTPDAARLYARVMNEEPGFRKYRDNLRAFDHIINNSDRESNPGNIMIHEGPAPDRKITFYAIDQDASLTPGARNVLPRDAGATLRPRSDLSASWTDPKNPVMGKISKSLYDEMLAMMRNRNSLKNDWKKAYGINDAAVEGVFGRINEVVVDYQDRLSKSNGNLAAVFHLD